MDWIIFLVLLITHTIAFYMGMHADTSPDQVQMYDTYLKWEHEKWLEERREKRDNV